MDYREGNPMTFRKSQNRSPLHAITRRQSFQIGAFGALSVGLQSARQGWAESGDENSVAEDNKKADGYKHSSRGW